MLYSKFGGFSVNEKTSKWILIALIAACILAYAVFSMQLPENGWASEPGGTVYYLDGKPVTGWQDIDGNRCYFGEDGILATGWQTIGDDTYHFTAGGIMQTGWLELGGKKYYLDPDGKMATFWQTIDGAQYYLGADGVMQTGMVLTSGDAYLLNDQGQLSQGLTMIDGRLYYGDEDGRPVSGWQQIGGRKYYFDETSVAATGWQQVGAFMHYFYADGSAAQGEVMIDGEAHYFASNGQHLYLVNPWHSLPEDYEVELVPISETHQIAAVACQDYLDMIADCKEAGFHPAVCSSYRTQEYQEGLFQNRVARYRWAGHSEEEATELAGQSVAVPGTSEHQLGLALDIVDYDNWHLDETQADMPTQKWLMENSWRYGWILRYPDEKSEITGIIYEPWHYRYVGKTVAKEIHDLDICLEEYLQMLTDSVG